MYNWANKKTYDGNWINGKMNGKGKFTYQDGSYYEGEFVNGKKNGYGIYKWDNDKYYEGKWKNDKQNGYGVYYDKNKVIKGFWVDGKIRNRNGVNFNIKKNKTYRENDLEYFDKKGITQEYFYKRYNLGSLCIFIILEERKEYAEFVIWFLGWGYAVNDLSFFWGFNVRETLFFIIFFIFIFIMI